MPRDPFPLPPGDAEEPDGFPLPPAADGSGEDWADGEGWADGGGEEAWADGGGPAGQGLYLCLPAGQVTLAGFAQGGEADTMTPGPLLATIVDTVTGDDGKGLAGCSDDQLIGIISAGRRMESRDAWTVMAAMAEYAARYPGTSVEDQFAADELACELHLTPLSAAEQMHYAATVARRLPATFAALGAGQIHPVHVRIIEDETRVLSDADAARADAVLAEAAPGLTFGKLRSVAHQLVLQLDPEAAQKRKEAARGQAHVRVFREDSGNAGLVARELPSDEALASWQHVEQRALDLRAAGMPGSLRELRVRGYLDLLQERDSRDLLADGEAGAGASETAAPDQAAPDEPAPHQPPPDQPPPGKHAPDQPAPASERPDPSDSGPGPATPSTSGAQDGPGEADSGPGPDEPGGNSSGPSGPGGSGGFGGNGGGPGRPAPGPAPASGPSVAALVTLTIPWDTWQGRAETPGEAGGFGTLDGDDARDLAAAAARHPRTRWCVTALNPDGTAAAHACLPGRHPPPGLVGLVGLAGLGAVRGPAPPPGTGPPPHPFRFTAPLISVTRGPCDHAHTEIGYHPSRKLAHLIRARTATCTAPGCGRPAARCDLDHTHAWDQGGRTCECNLAPLCRHHHRAKQAEGWQLEQPEPGVMIWRTPSGRSYTTTPTTY
jgi:Domain of unknown function (DUF222)